MEVFSTDGRPRPAAGEIRKGSTAAADADFKLARDLDTLRFRTDSQLNDIVRKAAAATGVPGEELFYDHVHLNFTRNFVVASSVAGELEKSWPGGGRSTAGTEIAESEVARRLAFTGFGRRRVAAEMRARLQKPPFTSQSSFRRRDDE